MTLMVKTRKTVCQFITLLTLLSITTTLCVGQKRAFEHLTTERGLSQNSVLAITQDERGFIWLGTRLGLNRFDGHTIKTYQNRASDTTTLTGNYIMALLTDSHQRLWVGTQNGLNLYSPATDSFERIVKNPQWAGNSMVNCLSEDRKGRIWVGTVDGLHQLLDPKTKRFQTYSVNTVPAIAGNNVRAVFEDSQGTIWVGTSEGLTRLTPKQGGYISYTYKHNPTDKESLSDSYVATIAEDKQQRIWIGTINGGLNRYNRQTNTFTRFLHNTSEPRSLVHNNIRKITLDQRGSLWIGTQEGLSIFDPVRLTFENYKHDPATKRSLNKNSIYSIFEDRQGSVWIGTYYGGANICYPYQTEFAVYQNSSDPLSLSDDVVSSIIEDKTSSSTPANLWVATEGGGLNYFDRRTGKFIAYKHNPVIPSSIGSNLVKCVYQDRAGNIWAGTHGGGLNLFDANRKTFQHFLFSQHDAASFSAEVLSIHEDSRGIFRVGTQQGLLEFRQAKPPLQARPPSLIQKSIGRANVKVILEDQEKTIWFGTSSGVFRLLADGQTVLSFANSVLGTPSVNCLYEDRQGRIWIGTYHEGVSVYDKARGDFTNYTVRDGLANDDVAGILQDNSGYIWISTGNGLSRFDPTDKTFINYTTSDGLVGNAFNYNAAFKSASGELLFGGYQGITVFRPTQIHVSRQAAPVVFTALRVMNKPVGINTADEILTQDISLTRSVTFRYDQNVFTLDFALLNYIKSNKNKYAYKLEGFDEEWNYIDIPSVTYTNLPTGNYTLLVKGANNDGLWSKPVLLTITILPPFWKTWWAYTIYALVVGAILFFITRYFILRALLKRDYELNQIKLNFFTNISHEIRTHLTLIAGPIERLLLARKDDVLVQQQLGYVQSDAERLLRLVNELMDFRKAETNNLTLHVADYDLIPFLNEIFLFFKEVTISKNIETSFTYDVESLLLYFDREQLEKVFFNLLSNAYKFTPDGGKISLSVQQQADMVCVQITDNGRGIAPQYLDKLFDNFFQVDDHGIQNTGYGIGLALSKTIVELHQGKLTVESAISSNATPNRTCFTVQLKTGKKHLEKWLIDSPLFVDPVAETHDIEDELPNPSGRKAETIATPMVVTQQEEDYRQSDEWLPVQTKRYTILLVEDNAAVRAFIGESLADSYQIIDRTDGLAGWYAAIELIPDLIISDVMMPEMDGFTLCNKLKTDERTNHIPVLLLTAKNAIASQVSGLAMGADSYLTKPFSLQVLRLHVRNLLATREKMRERFSRHITLQPQNIEVSSVDELFLKKIVQIIDNHMDDSEFDVDKLADEVGMSRSVLYKKLKALTDMSVNDFIKSSRLQKATQLLQQKKLTINEVAYAVGFSDRKYFSKEFKKQFGKSPSEYINEYY